MTEYDSKPTAPPLNALPGAKAQAGSPAPRPAQPARPKALKNPPGAVQQPRPAALKGLKPPAAAGPNAVPRSPAEEARRLAQLTGGAPSASVAPWLSTLAQTSSHVRKLLDNFGAELTANFLMGSTRSLAQRPAKAADELRNYRRPEMTMALPVLLLRQKLQQARDDGTLGATLEAFEAQTGKSLQTVLGERLRDAATRASLLRLLPAPISAAQLTHDAFLENIAVGFVYSNDSAATMNTPLHHDERRGGSPGQVLSAFGYRAGEPMSGAWGLQLRVFTPDRKAGKGKIASGDTVIIAFRGTEGVSLDAGDGTEGALDTLIGDFARREPGVNQYSANRAWIDAVVRQATAHGQKVTFVGHSLGGALAQEAAARYPEHTAGVVTFQAANIPRADAERVAAHNRAHPGQAVTARHYRVEGDTVPTSGTGALPGEIYYFDRVSRAQGSAAPMKVETARDVAAGHRAAGQQAGGSVVSAVLGSVPNMSMSAATSGHTVPILSAVLQGPGGGAGPADDAQRQALLQAGVRDENTLAHPLLDARQRPVTKDGRPVTTPVQEVGAVFAGSYATEHDPRLRGEAARAHVVPEAVALINGGAAAKVYEQNVAFNTAMHHLFELAEQEKTMAAFEDAARELLSRRNDHGKVVLPLLKEDIDLARQLHLDQSPRANALHALKELAGLDRDTAGELGLAGGVGVGTFLPGSAIVAGLYARRRAQQEFDAFIGGFSNEPTLEGYHQKGSDGYEVELTERVRNSLSRQLKDLYRMFHPGAQP